MAQWDFKLTRDDGSSILLHPQWSRTKITYKTHCPPFDGEYPRSGLGGTGRREPGEPQFAPLPCRGRDNSGTFKHFTQKDVAGNLKFDASKPVDRDAAPAVISPNLA